METKNLTCIGCPMGCAITVKLDGSEILSVEGNTCRRGDIYARKEVTNPTRIVTSSVRVKDGKIAQVSCKSASDIPKDMMFDIIKALEDVEVQAPVAIGDVIVKNVCGTGVDVIATKTVDAR